MCALTPIRSLNSTNFWNKLRDKILIEICECGWWTEFAKTSVCIILVVLVYFEPTKIYTPPKIVRVLKRVRNTELHLLAYFSPHQKCSNSNTRPIYIVVLASAVEGSVDVKIAQFNWTKTRTLELRVYMAPQNDWVSDLHCGPQTSGTSFMSEK